MRKIVISRTSSKSIVQRCGVPDSSGVGGSGAVTECLRREGHGRREEGCEKGHGEGGVYGLHFLFFPSGEVEIFGFEVYCVRAAAPVEGGGILQYGWLLQKRRIEGYLLYRQNRKIEQQIYLSDARQRRQPGRQAGRS